MNTFHWDLCRPSISQYREYDSPGRLCQCGAALRNFIRNTMHLKAFQNSFAFITSNAYQIALFSAFEKGISNPLIKKQLCVYHLQKTPESCLETLILHEKCGDVLFEEFP